MPWIVCVYGLISLLFKNVLSAVPFLILYMVYSNAGNRNVEGVYGYYGRPLAIMVWFPGRFFDTVSPPMALLAAVFCVDTYIQEIASKRAEVERLYPVKKLSIFKRMIVQEGYAEINQ